MTRKPPSRAEVFRVDVLARFELNRDELEVLTEVCRTLDMLDELWSALALDGLSVAGAAGQPRVHPAVAQINATRATLGRLLAHLALPSAEGTQMPSARAVRAQRAAQARWGTRGMRGA